MVFIDCGIIMLWIIEVIDNDFFFMVVCYLFNIFLVLQDKFYCCVIFSGGEFYVSNVIFKLFDFYEMLNNICLDIVFYFVVGVYISKGVICFNLEELLVKYWVMIMVQCYVLVVDYSKFGKVCLVWMGELLCFDMIISDCCFDEVFVVYVKV